MLISLEGIKIKYKLTLSSVFGENYTIQLNSSVYVDLEHEHKRTQFLINETKEMTYDLEKNELVISFCGEKESEIRIKLDRLKPEVEQYVITLKSLFTVQGDVCKNIDRTDVLALYFKYFSTIYALLFNEHTYCDNIYIQGEIK